MIGHILSTLDSKIYFTFENTSIWRVYKLFVRHRMSHGHRLYIFRPPAKRLKGNGLGFLWSSCSDTRTARLHAHIPEKTSVIKRERKTSFSGKARIVTPPNIPWVFWGSSLSPSTHTSAAFPFPHVLLGVSEWAATVAIFYLRDSVRLVKGDWRTDTRAAEASSSRGNTSPRSMSGAVLPALALARTARDMGLQRAMTLPDMWWAFGEKNIHYLSQQLPRRPRDESVARGNVRNWEKDMTNVWPCVFLWAWNVRAAYVG